MKICLVFEEQYHFSETFHFGKIRHFQSWQTPDKNDTEIADIFQLQMCFRCLNCLKWSRSRFFNSAYKVAGFCGHDHV